MKEAVSISGLNVLYHRGHTAFAAVREASFAIRTGETFGLFGPSGCGKSTILKALAGIERHWSGAIEVFGSPYRSGHGLTAAQRRDVQMVFQDPYASLHPRHRIRRILAEPLVVNGIDNPSGRAAEALMSVGLPPDVASRTPNALSGGQRQRVAIARALLLRPRLLLLDEPTSALDLSVQAEILNLLNDIKAAYGMTFLLVSHDRDVIAHMCDRTAEMSEGRIVDIRQRADDRPPLVPT
ncbi:MAG: ABC transporter ATP-binding protein [Ancalomicrobiaceae bacterium]|nr:ABC transporter ATP-binding protein [Ancalomicrobiaceae bacterium]